MQPAVPVAEVDGRAIDRARVERAHHAFPEVSQARAVLAHRASPAQVHALQRFRALERARFRPAASVLQRSPRAVLAVAAASPVSPISLGGVRQTTRMRACRDAAGLPRIAAQIV
jgi:hypothetical protein